MWDRLDCPRDIDLGSAGYLADFASRVRASRIPFAGALDLTYRCNYRCVHCYAGPAGANGTERRAELEAPRVLDLLSQACELGCLHLTLSGGEPLLRTDFRDIYVGAKQLGLILTVFTNASLITMEHLDLFSDYRPHKVDISFYGASEAVYERITGVPGSYRRALWGVERLVERGIPVALKTMVLRDNLAEVSSIEKLADRLGVGFRLDPLITPRLDSDLAPLAQRVDPAEAVRLEVASEARRLDMVGLVERMRLFGLEALANGGRTYVCGAGMSGFHLDPGGMLRGCVMSREFAYNTDTVGFQKAWRMLTQAFDRATWSGGEGCAGCRNVVLCGYCPGLFALEHASPSRPPQYVCSLGKHRREAVDRSRAEDEIALIA
jgi:MoaA/NifB/PqqE/SkfB family radical SAM enzyme